MTITRITQANSERIEIDERRYRRVAVIDLGSNSARLIIMRTLPDRFYYLEDEIREVVRLRSGMTEAGLSKEAMARGVATLRMFNRFCESLAVDELIATTTSAVREAANRDEFLAKVASKVGLRLRVLSGEEEAYYGAIGAQNALPLNEGVVLDIGGSAQLSLIKAGRWQTGQALTLGALALSERFVESDPPTRSEVRRIRKEVRRQLHEIPWLNEASPTVIGLGGTLRNLARVTIRHRKLPLGTVNGYLLRDDEIKYLVKRFRKLPLNRRQRLAGLSSDRADIIMAGAIGAGGVEVAGRERDARGHLRLARGPFLRGVLGRTGLSSAGRSARKPRSERGAALQLPRHARRPCPAPCAASVR